MRIVPARHGWAWLRDGARVFAMAPVAWMLLIFSYYLVISIISSIPYIGTLAGVICVPAFAASFMNIARTADQGHPVNPLLLFSGFRGDPAQIIALGGLYLAALAAVLGLSALADGGDLARYLMAGKMPDPQQGLGGLVVAMLAYIPVLAAFWFSPPLVAWDKQSAAKAAFFSFFAAWRNWRALLVYGLATSAIIIGGTWILMLVVQAVMPSTSSGGGRGPAAFAIFIFMPLVLAAVSVIFASFYSCYRDVFAPEQGTESSSRD